MTGCIEQSRVARTAFFLLHLDRFSSPSVKEKKWVWLMRDYLWSDIHIELYLLLMLYLLLIASLHFYERQNDMCLMCACVKTSIKMQSLQRQNITDLN